MRLAEMDLDLAVFMGPFDLLLTLVLKEEVDLLEVELAEIVLTYIDHLEQAGELDLEAATEFLVLIAALLELKSRMMLPREGGGGLDLGAGRGGRRADRPDARVCALPRRRRMDARAARGPERFLVPLGPAAARVA